MEYVALYRKYRPDTFDKILGQESVTKILKNQIKNGKISHAYIFSGSRGTGKTSAAKVFARAINCLNPHDGEPCNECEVCKNIMNSNITDVVEMDAASNNSVENIRQIRQEVQYATVDVKYRVYIIDEAHMLTTSAFNALLKTLEEPPKNVVFILATTEQHKIPVTILSRCLRFEFNRLSDDMLVSNLKYVLEQEKIDYDEEACKYIAKLADGGMRDALSILERCIFESDKKLTYEDVINIVGLTHKDVINKISNAILNYDAILAVSTIDELIKKSVDLRQLTTQLTENFLEILINSNESQKQRIINIIDRLSKLDNDIRLTTRPAIVLKSSIIGMCNNFSESTNLESNDTKNTNENNVLMQKISTLENKILQLEKQKQHSVTNVIPREVKINNNEKKQNIASQDFDKSSLNKFENMEELKKLVIDAQKLKLYSALNYIDIYFNDTQMYIITQNSFAYDILKLKESIDTLKNIFIEKYSLNLDMILKFENSEESSEVNLEKYLKDKNIKYTNLD